jgi:hypothetical protein
MARVLAMCFVIYLMLPIRKTLPIILCGLSRGHIYHLVITIGMENWIFWKSGTNKAQKTTTHLE